jgi:hypothetical protein
MTASTGTTVAVPPLGSAGNDLGRRRVAARPRQVDVDALRAAEDLGARPRRLSTSVALAISVEPVKACRRPDTSRASYVPANRIIDGVCASIERAQRVRGRAARLVGEHLLVVGVDGGRTVRAQLGAAAVAPGPRATAATSAPSERAFVSSPVRRRAARRP